MQFDEGGHVSGHWPILEWFNFHTAVDARLHSRHVHRGPMDVQQGHMDVHRGAMDPRRHSMDWVPDSHQTLGSASSVSDAVQHLVTICMYSSRLPVSDSLSLTVISSAIKCSGIARLGPSCRATCLAQFLTYGPGGSSRSPHWLQSLRTFSRWKPVDAAVRQIPSLDSHSFHVPKHFCLLSCPFSFVTSYQNDGLKWLKVETMMWTSQGAICHPKA